MLGTITKNTVYYTKARNCARREARNERLSHKLMTLLIKDSDVSTQFEEKRDLKFMDFPKCGTARRCDAI